jgi:hypothetical protein
MESLLLFRRALSSPTMCRFIPALSVPGFLRLFGKTLLTICEMPSGKLSPGRNEGIIHRLWGNLGHRPKKSGSVLASRLVFTVHLAD